MDPNTVLPPLSSFMGGAGEGLKLIGSETPESRTAFLQALVESVDSEIEELHAGLRISRSSSGYETGSKDLRRFLAVALSNLFTRLRVDDPFAQLDAEPEELDSSLDGDGGSFGNFAGETCPDTTFSSSPLSVKEASWKHSHFKTSSPSPVPTSPATSAWWKS